MLNNIRGILNRRNDSSKSPESPSRTSSVDGGDFQTSSAEGFICPTCLLAFPSAEILQNHYESTHSESESSLEGRIAFICSACKMKLGSEIELKSHYTRHHSGTKEEVEIETMLLQIKALEEGKALLNGQLLAIQSQASELTKENARTREERDNFKIKLTKQMDELANLKLEYDKVKSMKSSIESSLQSSKEKIRTLEIEIQQRPEADDVSLLQKELVSVQKMMDELTRQREAEKDVLKTQCNEVQEICLRLTAEKTELENKLKNYPKKDEFSNLQKKISEMSETIAKLERELMHKDAENKTLSENLKRKSDYDEMKTLIAEKNAALEDVQRICSEKDTQIAKLKEELKSATVNVQEMKAGREKLFLKIEEGEGASAAMLQLKEENIRLQDQYRQQLQLQNVADNEAEMKLEDLRSSLKKKYDERICEINAEKEVLIKDLNGSIEVLKKKQELDVSKNNELNALLENKSKMIEKLSLDMEKLKDQSKKDQQAYEKHTQHLGFEKKNLEKRLSDLGDTLPKLETELLEKKKLLAQAEDKLKQLSQQQEKENLVKMTELNQLQEQHKDNLSKINNLEKCVSELESSKVEFCDKISSLNEELLKSQLKESELSAKIDHFYEEHSSITMKNTLLEEESANLRSSVTTLQNEKNSLLNQIEFTKKDLVELHELMADKEKQCKELTEILQQQNDTLTKLKSGHKVERDILIKEKLELKKELESAKNSCEKQVSQIQETVTSLENQLTEAKEKTVLMKSAVDEASKVIKQKEKEFEEKESHYTAQLGVFTENVNTLREDLFSEQKQKDILQQNLDEITGSKLALEAKFENVLDERKSLLQRCLQSESECERLQKSSGDMRRKYDDCVAALQELGRENQTLQVENMKHVTRKWADDAEVINCTACTKLFTVTIRKHHCRNCGSIFCNECSSKTTTVAASKKPVRVCDVCYDEITK